MFKVEDIYIKDFYSVCYNLKCNVKFNLDELIKYIIYSNQSTYHKVDINNIVDLESIQNLGGSTRSLSDTYSIVNTIYKEVYKTQLDFNKFLMSLKNIIDNSNDYIKLGYCPDIKKITIILYIKNNYRNIYPGNDSIFLDKTKRANNIVQDKLYYEDIKDIFFN